MFTGEWYNSIRNAPCGAAVENGALRMRCARLMAHTGVGSSAVLRAIRAVSSASRARSLVL